MKNALPQISSSFLALRILSTLFNTTLRNIFSVEVAIRVYFVRQTEYPTEFSYRFAWKRTLLRYQNTRYIIDRTRLQHLIDEIGITNFIGFSPFDEFLISIDTI